MALNDIACCHTIHCWQASKVTAVKARFQQTSHPAPAVVADPKHFPATAMQAPAAPTITTQDAASVTASVYPQIVPSVDVPGLSMPSQRFHHPFGVPREELSEIDNHFEIPAEAQTDAKFGGHRTNTGSLFTEVLFSG
jgi:hypothetical protein